MSFGTVLNLSYFTEMCSGSEAGSYFRLIDFVYHSTLGLRVIEKKKRGVARQHVTVRTAGSDATLHEKGITFNLSGNEFYYTAYSLLLGLKDPCSKLHCQKSFNSIPLSYVIERLLSSAAREWATCGVTSRPNHFPRFRREHLLSFHSAWQHDGR